MEEPNWALEKSLKKVLFRDVVGRGRETTGIAYHQRARTALHCLPWADAVTLS